MFEGSARGDGEEKQKNSSFPSPLALPFSGFGNIPHRLWSPVNKIICIPPLTLFLTTQHLTGNSDKSTIVVHWFAPPFAAQYVRIFPKTYAGAICMRMDLFGCKDCKYNLSEGDL